MHPRRPIALVGMSGIGKSHWAKRLVSIGFRRHDCDGDIASRLTSLVSPRPGEEPVHALGRWMGVPTDPGYADREARYLALEAEVTEHALDASLASGDHVIDTTGSVIYLPEPLLTRLRERCHVVYLRTSDERQRVLLDRFVARPKPIVWGGLFSPLAGEAPPQTLARCYAALLAFRDARYASLAHVTLDGASVEHRSPAPREFLSMCEGASSP